MFSFCSEQKGNVEPEMSAVVQFPVHVARRPLASARVSSPVRDETLHVASGGDLLPLRAWRGRSGRRYVVSVYPLTAMWQEAHLDAVLIAVAREGEARRIVGVCESSPLSPHGFDSAWFGQMRACGAVELHVHLLATSAEARAAVVRDLHPFQ